MSEYLPYSCHFKSLKYEMRRIYEVTVTSQQRCRVNSVMAQQLGETLQMCADHSGIEY